MIEFRDECDHVNVFLDQVCFGRIETYSDFKVWHFVAEKYHSHEFSGYDYIAIGKKLNELNGVKDEE